MATHEYLKMLLLSEPPLTVSADEVIGQCAILTFVRHCSEFVVHFFVSTLVSGVMVGTAASPAFPHEAPDLPKRGPGP